MVELNLTMRTTPNRSSCMLDWLRVSIVLIVGSLTAVPIAHAQTSRLISGVVADSDGRPLDGVKLFLWYSSTSVAPQAPDPLDSPAAVTDSRGSFRIEVPGDGRYFITPVKAGFVYPRRRSAPAQVGTWIEVRTGVDIEKVRIAMLRESSIHGRVMDASGRPALRVPVSLLQYAYDDEGTRQLVSATGNVYTDDRGEYRFFGLSPGEYYLRAYVDSPVDRFAAVYYPGSANKQSAEPLSVKAGEEIRLNAITSVERETVEVRFRFPDRGSEGVRGLNSRSVHFVEGGSVTGTFGGFNGRPFPSEEWVLRLARGFHEVTVAWSRASGDSSVSPQSFSEKSRIDATGGDTVQQITPAVAHRVAVNTSFGAAALATISSSVRCVLDSGDHYVQVACNGETWIPSGSYALKIQDLPQDVYVGAAE